ncbi:hypothetical protein [Aneurinibacillus sp. REN35]|uniref:hypothetical protein n=1 Tax=Aneurinibacillus sp. REN35 TaxID=3237286 RepID=UPI0035293F02
MLWLTPVQMTEDGWMLGKARAAYAEADLQPISSVLREIHPRLLPTVKAAILPDEPEEEGAVACGTAADFDLSVQGDIVFDGRLWQLSHCGESFFQMLLPHEEVKALFASAPKVKVEAMDLIRNWVDSGLYAVIIKE